MSQHSLLARVAAVHWSHLVRIRPVHPGDERHLARVFKQLGAQSRRARFLYPKGELTDSELHAVTHVDHHDHEVLIAFRPLRRTPVAAARFVRSTDEPAWAEVAAEVADEWPGRGVGRRLAEHLARRAVAEGVSHFTATMAADNFRAQRLLRQIGRLEVALRDGSTTTYRVALGPSVTQIRPHHATALRSRPA